MTLLVLFSAACGGPAVEWAGKWREQPGVPVGTYVECTLGGSGHTVTGNGVQHREAGTPINFTVSGNTAIVCVAPGFCPMLTFTYDGGSTEGFSFAQGDANHIALQNPQRTVNLVRE